MRPPKFLPTGHWRRSPCPPPGFTRPDLCSIRIADGPAILVAAGSPRLCRFHAQLQQVQRLALTLAEWSSRELGRNADDHRQLLDALRDTPTRARAQLAAHLQAGAAELQCLLDLLAERKENWHGPDSPSGSPGVQINLPGAVPMPSGIPGPARVRRFRLGATPHRPGRKPCKR
jgi:hypothetical protein